MSQTRFFSKKRGKKGKNFKLIRKMIRLSINSKKMKIKIIFQPIFISKIGKKKFHLDKKNEKNIKILNSKRFKNQIISHIFRGKKSEKNQKKTWFFWKLKKSEEFKKSRNSKKIQNFRKNFFFNLTNPKSEVLKKKGKKI